MLPPHPPARRKKARTANAKKRKRAGNAAQSAGSSEIVIGLEPARPQLRVLGRAAQAFRVAAARDRRKVC